MNLFRKARHGMKKLTESTTLKEWQSKLETAKTQYSTDRNNMNMYQEYYKGRREVQADPNSGKSPTKVSNNVRNIMFELIESQVDSSIPMPKVRAIHPDDDDLAKKMEKMLENKVKTCNLTILNDFMERTTPVQGGDYFFVQWDVNAGLHNQVGDLKVTELHPKKVVPQPGVTSFDNMDYFFIQELLTKKTVKRIYGVDVEDTENDQPEAKEGISGADVNTDLVTVNTAYYRNDHNGIGVYIWCDTVELLSMEDYQARHLDRCKKCGAVMENGVCPECGSKESVKSNEDYEDLIDTITVKVDGSKSPEQINPDIEKQTPVTDENGQPVLDETGQPMITTEHEKKKVPYYKPNVYPVVLRKNISEQDRLLGGSDVPVIIDQQDTIKKLGSKINEKLLKGGSYLTLPRGKDVEKSDKELKIIRIDNAAEANLIQVLNIQPNVQSDENYLEENYTWAKSALGITDSYQGKYDASADSGVAKQYSINQAAGRLESKRTMKNAAYAKLYEIMFKFWLAYADEDTEITSVGAGGAIEHDIINRKDFLKIDASGEFYWDDEFIFDTDPTSTLMANREAMWNQTDLKLQSQAFGPLGDLQTLRTYWTFMKANGYPNAGMALDIVEQRIQKQQEQTAQLQAMTSGTGGDQNAVPDMSYGNADTVQ